jgi:hypothetical protein
MSEHRLTPSAQSLAWFWAVLITMGGAGAAALQVVGAPPAREADIAEALPTPPPVAAPTPKADVADALPAPSAPVAAPAPKADVAEAPSAPPSPVAAPAPKADIADALPAPSAPVAAPAPKADVAESTPPPPVAAPAKEVAVADAPPAAPSAAAPAVPIAGPARVAGPRMARPRPAAASPRLPAASARAAQREAWDRFVEHADAALAMGRHADERRSRSRPGAGMERAGDLGAASAEAPLSGQLDAGPVWDEQPRPPPGPPAREVIGSYELGPNGVRTFVRAP